MDVNEVKPKIPVTGNSNSTRQRPASALDKAKIKINAAPRVPENDTVATQEPSPSRDSQAIRSRINEAINASNLAVQSVNKISELVNSIDGIVEQVASPRTGVERRKALEKEAQELVSALRSTTKEARSVPLQEKPKFQSDEELEKVIRKTLESVLPDDTDEALGLKEINFSTADTIVATRAQVERAQKRAEALRASVVDTNKVLSSAVTNIDIALQNSEAANSSVRDLDEALRLTSQAGSRIRSDPERAIASLSGLSSGSAKRVLAGS